MTQSERNAARAPETREAIPGLGRPDELPWRHARNAGTAAPAPGLRTRRPRETELPHDG